MNGEFIYVGHSFGDTTIDGKAVKWDKVSLSNGIRTFAVLNGTGRANFAGFEPEKTKVICEFELEPVKGEVAKVKLVTINAKK